MEENRVEVMEEQKGRTVLDDALIRSGHRILCNAFAAYEWGDLRRDDDPDPLDSLLRFDEDALSDELLKLSVFARANDDNWGTLDEVVKLFPDGVGTLTVGDKTVPLSAREACNKIIHAHDMKLQLAYSDQNPIWDRYYVAQNIEHRGTFKVPALAMTGKEAGKKGRPWVTRLELVPFVYSVALTDMSKWNVAGIK